MQHDADIKPPDLTAYYQDQCDRIAQGQARILRELMVKLTQILLYGRKVQVDRLDLGYDCSDYPTHTHQPYREEDYETVGDFLQEATGQTIATYLSGYGFHAETLEEWVTSEIDSELFELLKTMALEYLNVEDELDSEAEDTVVEHVMEWVEPSLEQLKQVSLSWMLKAHRNQAGQRQAEQIEQSRQAALKQESNEKIATRVHQQGQFLLKQTKYNMAEQEQLFAALERLAEMVSATELDIYLHSSWFQQICSNRLQQLAQARFASARI